MNFTQEIKTLMQNLRLEKGAKKYPPPHLMHSYNAE